MRSGGGQEAKLQASTNLMYSRIVTFYVSYMAFPYVITLSKRIQNVMKVSKPLTWCNCVISKGKMRLGE